MNVWTKPTMLRWLVLFSLFGVSKCTTCTGNQHAPRDGVCLVCPTNATGRATNQTLSSCKVEPTIVDWTLVDSSVWVSGGVPQLVAAPAGFEWTTNGKVTIDGNNTIVSELLIEPGGLLVVNGDNTTLRHVRLRGATLVVEGDNTMLDAVSFWENSTLEHNGTRTNRIEMDRCVFVNSTILWGASFGAELSSGEVEMPRNYVLGKTLDATLNCHNETWCEASLQDLFDERFPNKCESTDRGEVMEMDRVVQIGCSNGCETNPETTETTCGVCPEGEGRVGTIGGCFQCERGRYSNPSSDGCIDCPPGSYAPEAGAQECTVCEAGRFQPADGMAFCDRCEMTASSAANATECTECDPGKWSSDRVTCDDCVCTDPYTDRDDHIESGEFCQPMSGCGVYCDSENHTWAHSLPKTWEASNVTNWYCGRCVNETWVNDHGEATNQSCPDTDPARYTHRQTIENGYQCNVTDKYWYKLSTGARQSMMCGECKGTTWYGEDGSEYLPATVSVDDPECTAYKCSPITREWNDSTPCGECLSVPNGTAWNPPDASVLEDATCDPMDRVWVGTSTPCGTCLGGVWTPPSSTVCDLTTRTWVGYPSIHCGTCNNETWVNPNTDLVGSNNESDACNVTEWTVPACEDADFANRTCRVNDYENASHPYNRNATKAISDNMTKADEDWYCNETTGTWDFVFETTDEPCGQCNGTHWRQVPDVTHWMAPPNAALCSPAVYDGTGKMTTGTGNWTVDQRIVTISEQSHLWAKPLWCNNGGVMVEIAPQTESGRSVAMQPWWTIRSDWYANDDHRMWKGTFEPTNVSSTTAMLCTEPRQCEAREVLCGNVPCFLLPEFDAFKSVAQQGNTTTFCPPGWTTTDEYWYCDADTMLLTTFEEEMPTCVRETITDGVCELPNQLLYPMDCDKTHEVPTPHGPKLVVSDGTNCTARCAEGWGGCASQCQSNVTHLQTQHCWPRWTEVFTGLSVSQGDELCADIDALEAVKCTEDCVFFNDTLTFVVLWAHETPPTPTWWMQRVSRLSGTRSLTPSHTEVVERFSWLDGTIGLVVAVGGLVVGLSVAYGPTTEWGTPNVGAVSTIFILWLAIGTGIRWHLVETDERWYVGPIGIGIPLALLVSARVWRHNRERRIFQAAVPVMLALLYTLCDWETVTHRRWMIVCVMFTGGLTIVCVVLCMVAVPTDTTPTALVGGNVTATNGRHDSRLRVRRVFTSSFKDL